jgi:ribosomal protein L35AE/L33A
MICRRAVLAATGVALLALALAAGAFAAPGAHPRHVAIVPPSTRGDIELGKHGGYRVSVELEDPDLAILTVSRFEASRLGAEQTRYGAHIQGSLAAGRVKADFGAIGSIDVRFRREGPPRTVELLKGCDGRQPVREPGRWVGKLSLRGEGGYFKASTGAAAGEVDRVFRLSCPVKHPVALPEHKSLREQVEPEVGASLVSAILGTVSSLEAVDTEGGRVVALRAGHANGVGAGAEVEAGAFEYEGRMPVGRTVQLLGSRPGTLVTSLPGERPATATLAPDAPFSGTAEYLATSAAAHSWTGTLAVRFPGLTVPLAGPGYSSTLCVVSTLVKPLGCEFQPPDWQGADESAGAER